MSQQIAQDHQLTIGASQAHRICTFEEMPNLPRGAINFIEDMCRTPDDEFETKYESPAMAWGNANEVTAVLETAEKMGCTVSFFGEEQRRVFAGDEYSNFLSALPDAIGELDGVIFTIEVKCLDTKNHDNYLFQLNEQNKELREIDENKWQQVQVQNLCAEKHYGKPVSSIIVLYDPRSNDRHDYFSVEPDHDFRAFLKQRVALAKQLYDSIKAEPDRAPIIYDGVMPETKLVKASENVVTPELLELGLPAIQEAIAHKYGMTIVDGVLKGGDVFDCETQAGRDLAKAFKKSITKDRTIGEKLIEPIYRERHEAYKEALAVKQGITKTINAIRDHGLQPLLAWEAEQKRLQGEILTETVVIEAVIKRDLNADILAIYQQLDPVLHAKVVETAKAISEYEKTENQASFLNKLFDSSKIGKALKQAFIAVLRPKMQEAA